MDERDRSLGYMTNLAARLFVRELARRLERIGLAPGHMPVFTALGDGSALTQKELATSAAVEQPTMAATLARMERDGWIKRLANPDDMRSALISLTPVALAKMDGLTEVISEVNALANAVLSEREQKQYLAALTKIVGALRPAGQSDEGI